MASEFLSYTALQAFNEVWTELSQANFICLMGDDSTDIATEEKTMRFVRYSIDGTIHVKYVGSATPDRGDAESIVNALSDLLKLYCQSEIGVFMKRVVCLTVDGASVMLGKKTGVAARECTA